MLFDNLDFTRIILTIPVILISLTIHELAHGYVAYRMGDLTAKNQGRLTLNPLKHLDPIGALLLLVAGFGWAKPVPVNPYAFKRNPQQGMAIVAIAGPLSNLCLAFLGGAFLSIYSLPAIQNLVTNATVNTYIYYFLLYFVQINVVLMVFNLIPIPPLDGSRVVAGFLSGNALQRYYSLERYGMILMLILVVTNLIGYVLNPAVSGITEMIFRLAGLT